MIDSDRTDFEAAMIAKNITEQDWAIGLLFSVQPSDRALRDWSGGSTGAYLMNLAEICDQAQRYRP